MGKGKKLDLDNLTFKANTQNVMEFEVHTGAAVLASLMDTAIADDEMVLRKEVYGTTHRAYALIYFLGVPPKLREKISFNDFCGQMELGDLRGKLEAAYKTLIQAFAPDDLFEEDEDPEDAEGDDDPKVESPGDGQTSGESQGK